MLDRLIVTPCFRVDPDLYTVLGDIQTELSADQVRGSTRTHSAIA